MDNNNFNNFFAQTLWGGSKSLHSRNKITSTDKNSVSSGQSSSSILTPSKLAQSQPPHSTNNRDLAAFAIDNRLYMDGLRHHTQQQQQQHQSRQNSFGNGSGMTIIPTGTANNSRDSNNNGLNSQSINFSSQKLLSRLDMDAVRSNINRTNGGCNSSNMIHHQHGTILFNTLNSGNPGNMMSGTNVDCFTNTDFGPDSTTPPPSNAISMPPSASSASSSSSTISTNLGLNKSNNGSQDGSSEKIKTPNSIRGKLL